MIETKTHIGHHQHQTLTFKNYILVNFANETKLEAYLLDPTFSTNNTDEPPTRRYDGFPTKFKVYILIHGEEFRLHSVFNGGLESIDFWDRAQFVFANPIWCDKIKLVFDEVTINGEYIIYKF